MRVAMLHFDLSAGPEAAVVAADGLNGDREGD